MSVLASERKGRRGSATSAPLREQLREAEVVALQLRVVRLAVTPEIDARETVAEARQVTLGKPAVELREHRALELEAFGVEVQAAVIVVDHHERPRAGDE